MCGDEKTTSWSHFFPSTMWFLGTKLTMPGKCPYPLSYLAGTVETFHNC